MPELTSLASHEQRAWLGVSEFKAWWIYKPGHNGELTMKCLLLLCSCQPFICILQVFASGFERHFLLDFSEAMFTMKQFERVGGSFCAFCLFLLPKGTTGEIPNIFTCLVCWSIFVCWHDVYLNFWHDLIRMKEVTYAIVLKLGSGAQGWRRWQVSVLQKETCLLGML